MSTSLPTNLQLIQINEAVLWSLGRQTNSLSLMGFKGANELGFTDPHHILLSRTDINLHFLAVLVLDVKNKCDRLVDHDCLREVKSHDTRHVNFWLHLRFEARQDCEASYVSQGPHHNQIHFLFQRLWLNFDLLVYHSIHFTELQNLLPVVSSLQWEELGFAALFEWPLLWLLDEPELGNLRFTESQ